MTMIAPAASQTSTSMRDMFIAKPTPRLAMAGLLGGLAGGLAEVIWIGLYSKAIGTDGFDVARHVADTVFPGILRMSAAPSIGFAIHFGLSAALGIIATPILSRFAGRSSAALFPLCLGALALVWCLNFGLVLPAINPTFPSLLPLSVTFASKLLFGLALAGVGHMVMAPRAGR